MSYKGVLGKNGRVGKDEQEFYELKQRAAEYYRGNGVPQKFEDVLNLMFFDKPADVYGYLANYFSRLSNRPVISGLRGSEVYDGKGQLTVQAQVLCTIRNEEKSVSSAVISTHDNVCDLITNRSDKRRDCVLTSIHWINEPLNKMLTGFDPADQARVDEMLSDFYKARFCEHLEGQSKETVEDKQRDVEHELTAPAESAGQKRAGQKGKKSTSVEKPLPPAEKGVPMLPGSMAIGAVSLAIAKSAAQLTNVPLYQHIRLMHPHKSLKTIQMPLPMVTLFHCGKACPGKLNLMEEVIVIPKAKQSVRQTVTMVLELQQEMTKALNTASKAGPVLNTMSDIGAMVIGYDRPEQALDLITEASNNLGLALGTDIHLAINCAAHKLMDYQKGKYDVINGNPKSPDELVDFYEVLTSKYPAIIALIDPFRQEDTEQWQKLSSALRTTCCLFCDAAFSGKDFHSVENTLSTLGVKGFVLKQTNQSTVTDLMKLTEQAQGTVNVVGTTSGESCCDTLSDLAVGLGVHFVKLGGLSRGERLTKYNRLISIEEELSQQGILGSREITAFPLSLAKPE